MTGVARAAYLHTSPGIRDEEAAGGGGNADFRCGAGVRNRERGALHAPEFTMFEWYRVGETLEALMRDCADMLAIAARMAGAETFRFRGREADPFAPPERLSVRDAFIRHATSTFSTACPPTGAASRTVTSSPRQGATRGPANRRR